MTAWIYAESICACTPQQKVQNFADPIPSNAANLKVKSVAEAGAPRVPGAPNLGSRYEVIDFIGEGGMGSVYKVRDTETNKFYAAKVLKPGLSKDLRAFQRFEREVYATSKLIHPNVLYIHGAFRSSNGTAFMLMNFVDGQNLLEMLRFHRSLPVSQAVHIFTQVAEALVYVHKKGIVHRDLKPSNILIYQDKSYPDAVRLVDFGIAKMSGADEAQALTQTGQIFGSPFYMSPEQCEGRALDARSDIYSLGCVMYEALVGVPPFSHPNALNLLNSHLHDPPKTFKVVAPGIRISKDLEKIVMRCLEKRPEKRYLNAEFLRKDLQAVAANAPISKYPNGRLTDARRLGSIAGHSTKDDSHAIDHTARARRKKLRLAIKLTIFGTTCFVTGFVLVIVLVIILVVIASSLLHIAAPM